MDTRFFFRASNSDSGDYYDGWVYDDGTYGYAVGDSWQGTNPDEDGYGWWTYEITGSEDYTPDPGVTVGTVFVTNYHDGETGADDTPAAYDLGDPSGTTGIGSENDTVDFGTGTDDTFGEGFYEADVADGSVDTRYHYMAVNSDSGDVYYGYVYDDGTYGYAVGDSWQGPDPDEDGYGWWTYTITGSDAYGTDTGVAPGAVIVTSYEDGETGLTDTTWSYDNGTYAGTGGLGSELDTVDFGTGTYDTFGEGFYEADVTDGSVDTRYHYMAVNSDSGDVYYGYVYDDGTYGYAVGDSWQGPIPDEDGYGWWTYTITGSDAYGTDTGVAPGTVIVTSYEDGESGLTDTPTSYDNGTYAGTAGLGSELDTVDFGTGMDDLFGWGFYEADVYDGNADWKYFYTAFNSASGDFYYGYVVDDGTYGYAVGDSWQGAVPDDDGYGWWTYTIHSSEAYGHDTGIAAGSVYTLVYRDGESGLWDTTSSYDAGERAGTGGLGSELDTVDFGTGTYDTFGEGYYEADVTDGSTDSRHAFYAVNSGSGDYYYGYVIDDGSYGYHTGYTGVFHTSDEDGFGRWTYTIYDSYDFGHDTGIAAGSVYTTYYYDGETGLSDSTNSYDTGTYSGYHGLGSEDDLVDFGTGTNDRFGRGYYEADIADGSSDSRHAFYAVNSASGDYYYGYVYDDGSYGYYTGYTLQLYTSDDDGYGSWTYTIYDSYDFGSDTGVAAGTVYTTYYADGETGLWDSTWAWDNGAYSGTGGLGSEYDAVDFGTGTYDYFGLGYFEADVADGSSDTRHAFYAVNSASGDYYYGYVIDDGTYGYATGDTLQVYTTDDDGFGRWTYTIYDSYALGYDAGIAAGAVIVTSYYDGETGTWDTTASYDGGWYAGVSGLGSEYDAVDFGTGSYDYYGFGYFEADVLGGSSDTVYSFYAVNSGSGDFYHGYVYDDGTHGYATGDTFQFYISDDDNIGAWTYTIYDAYAYGHDTGIAAGSVVITSYYDGETGIWDTTAGYDAGVYSGASGLGSEYDSVDFGTGTHDHFGFGYFEADLV